MQGHERTLTPGEEEIIAQSAEHSYYYATYVSKRPFPLGEPAIATDPLLSLRYAAFTLDAPFQAGEPAIAASRSLWAEYVDFFPERA